MGRKTGAWSTTVNLRSRRHQRQRNLRAIRCALPGQHDRTVPRRSQGRRGHRGSPQGAARLRARGQGPGGHPCRQRFVSSETPPCPAAPRGAGGPAATLAKALLAQGDRNGDGQLGRDELRALADTWYDKIDPEKSGRGRPRRLSAALHGRAARRLLPARRRPWEPPGSRSRRPRPSSVPTRRWARGPSSIASSEASSSSTGTTARLITVKVDEPDHPLNAPFKGQPPLRVIDETYTFARDTYSRRNVRVLTSIDYAAMSAEDKAKEQYPRPDGDYALSWIRREGRAGSSTRRTATTKGCTRSSRCSRTFSTACSTCWETWRWTTARGDEGTWSPELAGARIRSGSSMSLRPSVLAAALVLTACGSRTPSTPALAPTPNPRRRRSPRPLPSSPAWPAGWARHGRRTGRALSPHLAQLPRRGRCRDQSRRGPPP